MRFLFLCLLLQGPGAPKHHDPSDAIDEKELGAFLAEHHACTGPDQIYFYKVQQFDFLKKGYDQVVVVASTCMTGTAGPDVHSVFTRDENGELKELRIETTNVPPVLFGNRNSGFTIEDGLLVENYYDSSERDKPLVVKYKWDAGEQKFKAISVVAAKPYATSYDCAKAQKETEQAICYVETLADLDVELAQTYKAYRARLQPAARETAVQEQREWLKQRDAHCTIYKFWVDCLEERYKARIAELQARGEGLKKQSEAQAPKPAHQE